MKVVEVPLMKQLKLIVSEFANIAGRHVIQLTFKLIVMSAKGVIQGMGDGDLVNLFLEFVQTHRMDYEKHHKEISYKCYEATWQLHVAKATGYGRTEAEAYKNALKNLLELLMEEAMYIEFFAAALQRHVQPQSKLTTQPMKPQLKTEGHQPQEKPKNYDSFAKVHYPTKAKQDIHHSKINLNRSMSMKPDTQAEEAKQKIKVLEARLTAVLEENRILRERLGEDKCRPSFKKSQVEEKRTLTEVKPRHEMKVVQPKAAEIKLIQQKKVLEDKRFLQNSQKVWVSQEKTQQKMGQKSEKSLLIQSLQRGSVSKMAVPKLNLQVLPNYHKKSQKCLNDMLLATYQQKHGIDRKLL